MREEKAASLAKFLLDCDIDTKHISHVIITNTLSILLSYP